MNTRILYTIIAITWTTAILIPLPYYLALQTRNYKVFSILQILVRLLLEAVPCFMLIVAYLHMAYIARKQMKRVQHQRTQLSHNYSCSMNVHIRPKGSVRSVGCVVLIFLLCYAVAAYKGFLNYVVFHKVPDEIVAVARMLYHLNSAANCIVYALFRQDVRHEIIKVFRKKPARELRMSVSEHKFSRGRLHIRTR